MSMFLVGDGEMQEGQNWEAIMYAGFKKTKGLAAIVDYNKVQLTGTTSEILCLDPLDEKFQSFGWQTLECDGHNIEEVVEAIEKARDQSTAGPSSSNCTHRQGKRCVLYGGQIPMARQVTERRREKTGPCGNR